MPDPTGMRVWALAWVDRNRHDFGAAAPTLCTLAARACPAAQVEARFPKRFRPGEMRAATDTNRSSASGYDRLYRLITEAVRHHRMFRHTCGVAITDTFGSWRASQSTLASGVSSGWRSHSTIRCAGIRHPTWIGKTDFQLMMSCTSRPARRRNRIDCPCRDGLVQSKLASNLEAGLRGFLVFIVSEIANADCQGSLSTSEILSRNVLHLIIIMIVRRARSSYCDRLKYALTRSSSPRSGYRAQKLPGMLHLRVVQGCRSRFHPHHTHLE